MSMACSLVSTLRRLAYRFLAIAISAIQRCAVTLYLRVNFRGSSLNSSSLEVDLGQINIASLLFLMKEQRYFTFCTRSSSVG